MQNMAVKILRLNGKFSKKMLKKWIADSGAPEGQRGRADNPTGDGITNVFKFIFGLDVMAFHAGAPMQNYIHEEDGETYLAMVFNAREDLGDITLTVQNAPNLHFNEELGAVILSNTPNGDGTDEIVVRSLAPLSARPNQFMRLVAE